jgi:hypothetical protein
MQPIRISEAFFDERSREDDRSGAARVRISIVEGYIPRENEHAENGHSMSGAMSVIF